MKDLISRQAAIDAILAIKDYGNSDRANALGLAECAVTTLPSVQPEQIARDIATIIENEKDMRVILKNEHTETHSCDCQHTETHDLVIRRSAIDSVCEVCENCEYFKNEKLIQTIKDLPSAQPRWVSMEEAFPDDEGKYMVTWITPKFPNKRFIGIAEYEITRWIAENSRWEGEWLFDDYMNAYVDVTVTAWMPLPEPWRGGQDETN